METIIIGLVMITGIICAVGGVLIIVKNFPIIKNIGNILTGIFVVIVGLFLMGFSLYYQKLFNIIQHKISQLLYLV